MKYIFTLTLLLLLSGAVRAEHPYFIGKPIPAQITPRTMMEIEQWNSVGS